MIEEGGSDWGGGNEYELCSNCDHDYYNYYYHCYVKKLTSLRCINMNFYNANFPFGTIEGYCIVLFVCSGASRVQARWHSRPLPQNTGLSRSYQRPPRRRKYALSRDPRSPGILLQQSRCMYTHRIQFKITF